MLQYVNSFNCICDSNEGNVIVRFSQTEPRTNDDGSISTEQHDVVALVISRSGVDALIRSLNDVTVPSA